MSCFDITHPPVATTARAAAAGLVSMSTRPDPEGLGTIVPPNYTQVQGHQRYLTPFREDSRHRHHLRPTQIKFYTCIYPYQVRVYNTWVGCGVIDMSCFFLFLLFFFFQHHFCFPAQLVGGFFFFFNITFTFLLNS